jgi:hypothetical protein
MRIGALYAPLILETFLEGEEGIFLPCMELAVSTFFEKDCRHASARK